jgi:hypothetical protein
MKNFYFILLVLAVVCGANAQPVITKANYPNAGESFTGNIYLMSAPFNPGASGANQTWDFSGITSGWNTAPFDYVEPSATPAGATFPSSNLALSAVLQYSYFISTPTDYQVSGSVVTTTSTTIIPLYDPQKIISFPFTFGNEFKDTARSVTYAVTAGNNQRRTIYSKSKADAYGTITVPGGTIYNNVLRLLTTSETIDSTFNSSNVFIKKDISIDTNYYWISQDQKPHVFLLNKSQQGLNPPTTQAQYFSNPAAPTGVLNAYDSHFSLYPNPFSEDLFVEIDEFLFKSKPSLSIAIINSNGKEIARYPMKSSRTKIARNNLSSGLYLYKIISEDEILSTGKLTVH